MASPIGILDSGVGGLSVLLEIQRLLPQHPLHYIGDSAWCPYGNKSPAQIIDRVTILADHLISEGAELITVACNSATIHAVETLRSTYPIPIVGMEPAIKPAAAATQTGTIGILATEASLAGEKFHKLLNHHAEKIRAITIPAPGLVTLVENGDLSSPHAEKIIRQYTDPLLAENADIIVLGCTHYPFLRPLIESILPPNVRLIDTGHAVAQQVQRLLSKNQPTLSSSKASLHLQTTGPLTQLQALLPTLCPTLHNQATLSQLTL